MSFLQDLYGAVFTGAIAAGLLWLAFSYCFDNPVFSILLGLCGITFAFYPIGLFLQPILDKF